MTLLRGPSPTSRQVSSKPDSGRPERMFSSIRQFLNERDPSYRFDWEVYTAVLEAILRTEVRWLDAGCGRNLWIEDYAEFHRYPTHHRFNSPAAFKRGIPGFTTANIALTESLFTFWRPAFRLHHLLYSLTKGPQFGRYYSIITATLCKS